MKKNSLALLLSMITFSATSRGQAVPASCTPPPECAKSTKNNPFCIDASSGPPAQSASYGHSSVVGVWLINKNPFRYDYQVKTTLKDFSKEDFDAMSAFGKEIGMSLGSTPSAPSADLGTKTGGGGQVKVQNKNLIGETKSACQVRLGKFKSLSDAAETALKAAQQEEKELADHLNTGPKGTTPATLSGASGEEVCRSAVSLRDSLANFITTPISGGRLQGRKLDDAAELLNTDLGAAKDAVSRYEGSINEILPCKTAGQCLDPRFKTVFMTLTGCTEDELPAALEVVENQEQYLQTLKPLLSQAEKEVTKISTARCVLDAVQTQIASVLSDDSAFVQRLGPFGPYSDSEDVSITVSHTDKKQKDACNAPAGKSEDTTAAASPRPATLPAKPRPSSSSAPDPSAVIIADVTLHFGGGQRVYAAAGPTVSFLSVKEFQRATGFTSGTTAGTIIDFKTDSSTRVSPLMGFLHWRPLDNEHLFLSFGATAKSDNQSTSAEFLFGPSWGFLGNRIFFTGGAYVGQQQKLAGNLHIGDTVPGSLTGEIPVQKSYHWSGGFSINFRISGAGGSSPTAQPKTPKKAAGSGSQ